VLLEQNITLEKIHDMINGNNKLSNTDYSQVIDLDFTQYKALSENKLPEVWQIQLKRLLNIIFLPISLICVVCGALLTVNAYTHATQILLNGFMPANIANIIADIMGLGITGLLRVLFHVKNYLDTVHALIIPPTKKNSADQQKSNTSKENIEFGGYLFAILFNAAGNGMISGVGAVHAEVLINHVPALIAVIASGIAGFLNSFCTTANQLYKKQYDAAQARVTAGAILPALT
jgi:hypothetical protein